MLWKPRTWMLLAPALPKALLPSSFTCTARVYSEKSRVLRALAISSPLALWWRPPSVLPVSEPVSEAPSRTRKTSLPCPPTTFSKPVKRKPRPALSPASFMAWAVEDEKELWVMPLALPLTQPALVPVMLSSRLAVLPERSMMSPPAPPRSSSRVVAAAHCRVLLPRRALNSASSTVTAAVCRLKSTMLAPLVSVMLAWPQLPSTR